MAIREREYIAAVDSFRRPEVKKEKEAIAMLLLRLLLLNPGSDPLHPDMGVGITRYRYGMNTLPQLEDRIDKQLRTYLPCFPSAEVKLEVTDDRLLIVNITVNDTIYIFDSNDISPITIDDVYYGNV